MTAPIAHGYPDWGRFAARADTVWIRSNGFNVDVSATHGPFLSAAYQFLRIKFTASANHFQVFIEFYEDQAGMFSTGIHNFECRQGTTLDWIFPILGPWMAVIVVPNVVASTYTLGLHSAWGPYHPTSSGPDQNLLINRINESVPAGATENYDATFIWPAEAHWFAEKPAGTHEIRLVTLDTLGNETPLSRLGPDLTSTRTPVFLTARMARIKFVNSAAAAAVFHATLVGRPIQPGA